MVVALLVVAFELVALAWMRHRFFGVGLGSSVASFALGGALVAPPSAGLGGLFGQRTPG